VINGVRSVLVAVVRVPLTDTCPPAHLDALPSILDAKTDFLRPMALDESSKAA
jgi:hypothetical protein